MQVRFPRWDFAAIRAHWAPNHEFAQINNANSIVPAYIEPYLVKVMLKAQAALPAANVKLHRELAIFIKQEMQHCKQHLSFNKSLRSQGYEGLLPIEREYEADYVRFLETRPLRFNLAYCEGFEAISAIPISAFFEDFDHYLAGADEAAVELWKWHLAEEHEHREVAHDVYHALVKGNAAWVYLYRIYGFFYAARHISSYVNRATAFLLDRDREGMTPAEVAASKARAKAVKKAFNRHALRHLRQILSPFYDPHRRAMPRGVEETLARYEKKPVALAA